MTKYYASQVRDKCSVKKDKKERQTDRDRETEITGKKKKRIETKRRK